MMQCENVADLALQETSYPLSTCVEFGLYLFRQSFLLWIDNVQEAIHINRLAKFDVGLGFIRLKGLSIELYSLPNDLHLT